MDWFKITEVGEYKHNKKTKIVFQESLTEVSLKTFMGESINCQEDFFQTKKTLKMLVPIPKIDRVKDNALTFVVRTDRNQERLSNHVSCLDNISSSKF